MKTSMSRFQIHDDLTAPEGSVPVLRGALATAEHYHSEPGIAMHSRAARAAGVALDEVANARQFTSKDEREAALLRYLRALLENDGRAPMHLHEEAREA